MHRLDLAGLLLVQCIQSQIKRLKIHIKNFSDMLTELSKNIDICNVDIWSQDETRVWQQGSLTRIWSKRGTRRHKVRQSIHFNIYLRGCVP
jgi:hypothetical protein